MSAEWPELKHTTVIGFGHRARQGKDSACLALERVAPMRVRRFSFADALRAVCRVSYGMTAKDAPLLQRVGVEWRAKDRDVWVRACLWSIAEWDATATGPQVACIPDVRFPNEADLVTNAGGHLVRIRRWQSNGQPYLPSDRDPNHESETALERFEWPHTIENDTDDLLGFTLDVQALGVRLVPDVFHIPVGCACQRA